MTDLHTLEHRRQNAIVQRDSAQRIAEQWAAEIEKLDKAIEAARWEALTERYGIEMREGLEIVLTQALVESMRQCVVSVGETCYLSHVFEDDTIHFHTSDYIEFYFRSAALVAEARKAWLAQEGSR